MSSDEAQECPLCMEPLELDDINFYPCKCEYQICRFCWHRIRTDENGLCPACRAPYPEDPVNFKPLSAQELARIKSEKKAKQAQQKHRMSESRKHLANLRVIQESLVYVMGLSPRIADNDTLKKPEYFGKFGRIIKVAVGAPGGQAQSSCTAYVTYSRAEEALRAIQAVNNVSVEGRTVKASLGTTKYCSAYLRNQPCHKPECMYLHDLAKEEASFTKEDMQSGRHTEYERRLHEAMQSSLKPATSEAPRASSANGHQEPNGVNDRKDTQPPRYSRLKTASSVEAPSEGSKGEDSDDMGRILAAISAQASARQSVYSTPEPLPAEEEAPAQFPAPPPPEPSWSPGQPNGRQPDTSESSGWPRGESSDPTDWQEAFGLKPKSTSTAPAPPPPEAHPHLPASLFDDDALGFDPFSESSKGLADLMEEEEREREQRTKTSKKNGARPNGFGQSKLGSSWTGNQAGGSVSSSLGSVNSLGNQHRTGTVSPSTLLGALSKNGGLKPGSLPSSEGGASPVPTSFTTPPPGFPAMDFVPNGLRYPPPPGFPPPPPFRDPSPSQPRLHYHHPPPHPGQSQEPGPFNMAEWQEGLKNLLPNVNVHFAPGLASSKHNNWGQPPPGRGPTPTGPPPGLPPFHQPPPPLSISTSGAGGGMRPSPPHHDHPHFHRMPPPPHGPRPPPPPGFPGGQGGWNCLTPPPPGFSPRQH